MDRDTRRAVEEFRHTGAGPIENSLIDELVAAGMPLLRVATASEVFHPTLDAMTRRWIRGRGIELEECQATPRTGSGSV